MTTPNDKPRPPVDDEALMRFIDGELDPETAEEVEALLAREQVARDKRAGLLLAGALLRERVESDSRADGIAEAVMARLDEAASLPPLEGLDDLEAAPNDLEPSELSSEVALPQAGASFAPPSANRRAANDNARAIFTLAAAAAAVAAGMFLWGQTDTDDTIALAPPADEVPAEVAASEEAPPWSAEPAPPAEAEEPPAPVEVAAVDFGAQSGSVFYVADHGAATAVVWVTGGDLP